MRRFGKSLPSLKERLKGLSKQDLSVLDAVTDISKQARVSDIILLRLPKGMTSSRVSRILHKLERRGLIKGQRATPRVKFWEVIDGATLEEYRRVRAKS